MLKMRTLYFILLILSLRSYAQPSSYFSSSYNRTLAFLKITDHSGRYFIGKDFYDSLLAARPSLEDQFFCHAALAWYHRNNDPENTTNEIILAKNLLSENPNLLPLKPYLLLAEAKAYRHFNQFEKAIEFLEDAKTKFEEMGEPSMAFITQNQIALTMGEADNLPEALKLQYKVLKGKLTLDNANERQQLELYGYSTYSTLLTIYAATTIDSLDKAQAILLHTIEMAETQKHGYIISNAKGNLAYIYMLNKQYRDALGLARIDMNYSIKANRVVSIAHLSYLMAEIFYGMGQLDSVRYYINKGEQLIENFSKPQLINDFAKLSLRFYATTGEPDAAFASMQNQLDRLNQLYLEKSKTDFELLRAERDLQDAELHLEQLQLKNTLQMRMAFLLIVLLVAVTLLLLYIFRQHAHLKNQNKQLELLNNTLEEKVERRTKKILEQNLKIKEITFRNSHRTRAPVARLLGLVELLSITSPENQAEILEKINASAKEIDEVIFEMNSLLSEE